MDLTELTDRAMQTRAAFSRNGNPDWTPMQVMEGFVVDVGDLMRLAMAKSGARHVEDLDRKFAHELSDCLWSVLVLARLHGVDLESEFQRTLTEIEAGLAARRPA